MAYRSNKFLKRKCLKCEKYFTPVVGNQRFCGSIKEKTGCAFKRKKEVHRNFYLKQKAKPNFLRNQNIKHRFGITGEQYDLMLLQQNEVCAICKNPELGRNTVLSVDHNHNTGKIRGLLCNGCNLALGLLKDNSYTLYNAIKYLSK